MKNNQLAIVLLVFSTSLLFAQSDPLEEIVAMEKNAASKIVTGLQTSTETGIDLFYQRFEWTVDPAEFYIAGEVAYYFTVTENQLEAIDLEMYNPGLEASSIRSSQGELDFLETGDFQLKISLKAPLPLGSIDSLVIQYQGVPNNTGFGSFETDTHGQDSIPLMWTLSEPYGARDWRPVKQDLRDKVDSTDIYITTNAGYRAASNGVLLSERTMNNQTTFHWKHRYPIPAYLVAFAITNYAQYSDWVQLDNGDSLEILNYVFPEDLADAQSRTRYCVDFMEYFNNTMGLYPFVEEKYGHAQCGFGGGMEHTTMSFMGKFTNALMAHELAHQWFGDQITCGSWRDIWLNEGFATYFEGLTYEAGLRFGPFKTWLIGRRNNVFQATDGSVYVDDTTSVSRIFSGRLSYSKGAMVLHTLRWVLGDDDFFQALRNYLNDPALQYGFAKTPDLQRHFETQSGRDLDYFFEDWIYGEGWPAYTLSWSQNQNGRLRLHLYQEPSHPSVDFFEIPVPIRLLGSTDTYDWVVDHTANGQIFEIDPQFEVEEVVFDPDLKILARFEGEVSAAKNLILKEGTVSVHPNPAKDQITVSLHTGEQIELLEVFDLEGQIMVEKETASLHQAGLNITMLPKGIYTLKLTTSAGKIGTVTFVKE